MSRYVNIATRIWHDEKIRTLPEDARSLFMYLLTSPHSNMCGIYFLPALYACHDLQWDEPRYRAALAELGSRCVIKYDGDIIFIKNFVRYNPIKGPKQAVGAAKRLKEVPETKLIHDFVKALAGYLTPDALKAFCKEYGYPIDTLSNRVSDTPPIPEAEADTDTEAEAEAEGAADRVSGNGVTDLREKHPGVVKEPAFKYLPYIDTIEGLEPDKQLNTLVLAYNACNPEQHKQYKTGGSIKARQEFKKAVEEHGLSPRDILIEILYDQEEGIEPKPWDIVNSLTGQRGLEKTWAHVCYDVDVRGPT